MIELVLWMGIAGLGCLVGSLSFGWLLQRNGGATNTGNPVYQIGLGVIMLLSVMRVVVGV